MYETTSPKVFSNLSIWVCISWFQILSLWLVCVLPYVWANTNQNYFIFLDFANFIIKMWHSLFLQTLSILKTILSDINITNFLIWYLHNSTFSSFSFPPYGTLTFKLAHIFNINGTYFYCLKYFLYLILLCI